MSNKSGSFTINDTQILGRLTRDPKLSYTGKGTAVVNLTLATNRVGSDKADFHRVVLWGKAAEAAQEHLSKGRRVYVRGELRTRSYKADGKTRYFTELHTNFFNFVDSKLRTDSNETNDYNEEDAPTTNTNNLEDIEDELPQF